MMNKFYLKPFLVLLCIETMIALFIRDSFIRPFLGDYLAVIMLYCLLRILNMKLKTAALASLLFACGLEFFQWTEIGEQLNIYRYKATHLLIGRRFHPADILFYVLAYFTILILDKQRKTSV